MMSRSFALCISYIEFGQWTWGRQIKGKFLLYGKRRKLVHNNCDGNGNNPFYYPHPPKKGRWIVTTRYYYWSFSSIIIIIYTMTWMLYELSMSLVLLTLFDVFSPVYTQRCQTWEYPYNTAGTGQALWLRLCQSFK